MIQIAKKGKSMEIANRIKSYLIEADISAADLSNRADISSVTVSSVGAGSGEIDCVDYYKICRALNVDLEMFLN